jgi:hypothetical protein
MRGSCLEIVVDFLLLDLCMHRGVVLGPKIVSSINILDQIHRMQETGIYLLQKT